jgi:hypothetical protein
MPGAKGYSIHVQVYMLTQMLFWFLGINRGTDHHLIVQSSEYDITTSKHCFSFQDT